MLIVSHLRTAIKKNEFELFYQPKIDSKTNSIVGVEALLRWNNPYIGTIMPEEFIPIAEETGLITQIGPWVLERVMQQYGVWYKKTNKMMDIKISINISACQFNDDHTDKLLTKLFKKNSVPVDNVLLELTETAVMKKTIAGKLESQKKIMRLGIGISIDDFGTGYSSLSYLQQLPIKELKIDKSFTHDIGKNKNSEMIIKAIITLARSLNINIAAEGVETKKQLDFLTKNKCNIIQGHYYSEPLNASEMHHYIMSFDKA